MSTVTATRRAPAMSAVERRAMIVEATIPLLLEHGADVTSRQIAEAAGIAEGTVFRAFGDKDAVIAAAVDKYLDPEPLRESLRAIDAALPLEAKVASILRLLQRRFSGVFSMMAAAGRNERPARGADARHEYASIIARAVEPELARLNCPPERVGPYLRLLAFATSIPQFNASSPVDLDELVRFAVNGIAGAAPASADSTGKAA